MSKTTILIVEEGPVLREALLDTLLLGNYEVVAADCAEEALMVLSSRSVDLVVSDIQMGEMSGLTLLKSIKTKFLQCSVSVEQNIRFFYSTNNFVFTIISNHKLINYIL